MPDYLVQIILIVALILVNGFFAGSEIALVSARKSRIRQLAESGDPKARLIEKLHNEPDRLLATVQVGVTVVGTLAGVIGGAKIVHLLNGILERVPSAFIQRSSEGIAITLVVLGISYLSLLIGELVPKYIAYLYAEAIALQVVKPIIWSSKIFALAIKFLTFSAGLVTRAMGVRRGQPVVEVSEEEVKLLVREGERRGVFEKTERELIHSVFAFTDTTVRKAMTPRTDIVAIDFNSDQKKILRIVTEEGYSRYPVYQNSLDNIVGIIHTKDVINLLVDSELIILLDILRKPYFVPDSRKIGELLRDFQRLQIHMAIVLDEFGGTAGLITLEDILEEIVGEIQDEHDLETEPFVRLPDGSAWVAGRFSMAEFRKHFPGELPESQADTLGGYLIDQLGRIPSLSEQIQLGEFQFTIMEKAGHRLTRLQVQRVESNSQS